MLQEYSYTTILATCTKLQQNVNHIYGHHIKFLFITSILNGKLLIILNQSEVVINSLEDQK